MILKGLSLQDSSCEIEVHGQFSHVIIWNLMVKK
jgi:hypothetical protein